MCKELEATFNLDRLRLKLLNIPFGSYFMFICLKRIKYYNSRKKDLEFEAVERLIDLSSDIERVLFARVYNWFFFFPVLALFISILIPIYPWSLRWKYFARNLSFIMELITLLILVLLSNSQYLAYGFTSYTSYYFFLILAPMSKAPLIFLNSWILLRAIDKEVRNSKRIVDFGTLEDGTKQIILPCEHSEL